jgi:hypothetical protein
MSGAPTIEDYLNYVPVEMFRSENSTGTGTTVAKNPRQLSGITIQHWTEFSAMVGENRQLLLKRDTIGELDPLIEKKRKSGSFESESSIEISLSLLLYSPIWRLLEYIGLTGEFVIRPRPLLLDADFAWSRTELDSSGKPRSIPRFPIEVKTFWALDVKDGDLVRQLAVEGDDPRCATRAISQIYGYMSVNNFRYGILTTYEATYFLRRVKCQGNEDGSTLEITNAVYRSQTRASHGFTLMEAMVAFILLAEDSFLFGSPYSTPDLNHRASLPKIVDIHVFQEIKLGDIYFGQKITHGQLGSIVFGNLRGQPDRLNVVKLVDASKSSDIADKLVHEVNMYKVLQRLQGLDIPKVVASIKINNWMFGLVQRHCGVPISKSVFWANFGRIRAQVERIHQMGVAHRDLKFDNILVDDNGKVTIIDFTESIFASDGSFHDECEKDLAMLDKMKE